ncbi:hypothetical protein J3L16_01795 [Alteromonas sp. 5E99-2]|uniref:hypothetical protein n=1 Tax=Alteromonas sp. 5E99-2 TaxID=2817683 RepID=UPI001A995A04|nr:hypothetical protein [Alteromonas sp. 5E99-2]MBO1254413.1 hypothetical protein [Alteromonas sp. 5E99-2]
MLKLTLSSILNQKTSFDYKILVVCNEIPTLGFTSDKLEFLKVDFPVSGSGGAELQPQIAAWTDKGAKVVAGLAHVRENPPEKVFVMDADDWINENLVEYIMSNPSVDNWYVDGGYLVDFGLKKYIRKSGLVRYCGSTVIFDYQDLIKLTGIPSSVTAESSLDEIKEQVSEHSIVYLLGHHRFYLGALHKMKMNIKPIDIPAICWVVNTGENRSGVTAKGVGVSMPHKFLSTFGMEDLVESENKDSVLDKIIEQKYRLFSYLGWAITSKTSEKV